MLKWQLKKIKITRAIVIPISAITMVLKTISEVRFKGGFINKIEPETVID
jgi:hypothetical protein